MSSHILFQSGINAGQVPAFFLSASAIRAQIGNFARKASNLSDQIFHQNEPSGYQGPVVIHDHHYYNYPSPWLWYDPSPRVVVVNPLNNNDKKKDDEGAALLLAIVSSVVIGVALYSLGSSIGSYQDASQELEDTEDFRRMLTEQQFNPSVTSDLQNQMAEVIEGAKFKERICSRVKNSAVTDIFLKTIMLGSAGMSLTGAGMVLTGAAAAATTASSLMTGGVIAGLITGGAMLFKWGFDSTDTANQRDALSLKASVVNLIKL